MWKWHLKLGLERSQKVRAAGTPDEVIEPDPESPQEVEQALATLKALMKSKDGPAPPPAAPRSGGYTPSAAEAEQLRQMLRLLGKVKK